MTTPQHPVNPLAPVSGYQPPGLNHPDPNRSDPGRGEAGSSQPELVAQMVALLRSELRKTYSTAAWWALLIPAALLSLLVNLATAQGNGLAFTPGLGMALALSSFSSKLAVIYGVVCASSEFRHRTITTSFLTAPGRVQLILAKAVVAALVGAVYGAVSAIAGILGAMFAGGLSGGVPENLLAVCGVAVVTFALWGALGVGVATLMSSQLAAIVAVLVYLLLVEQVVSGLVSISGLGQIESYMPGGAANTALTELASEGTLAGTLLGAGTTPWWLALLIFAGYSVLAVLAGAAVAQRRDVT
ncbi:MAG TPA: ABC transporter permease [Pseudonocardia sp.]|jgi:ABC-type transport system involved in multi-copper enzyme maturation permease subunit|nr:ABC transporter permease [Pseudonocardia sp.]